MNGNLSKKIVLIILLIVVSVIIISCDKEPIKIGFIGSLTSKQSQLSIDARNAIQLEIERINENGGIKGRPLMLVAKDDKVSYEVSLEKYNEFIEENVHLVIGPMTSSMTDAVLDAPKSKILFISPSMSTKRLKDIDDNILRTTASIEIQGVEFLKFINNKNYKHIIIMYDLMNEAYTENLAQDIKKDGEESIREISLITFDSRLNNLETVLSEIDTNDINAVLTISQAIDTAFIVQNINKQNSDIDFYSVPWSMTEDLIHYGGKAIEGMHLVGLYKAKVKSDEYIRFESEFKEKFNYEASFITKLAYDAFHVLVSGMENAKSLSAEDVKKSIIEIGEFNGIEEPIVMNQFGDSRRNYMIYEITDGEFVPIY